MPVVQRSSELGGSLCQATTDCPCPHNLAYTDYDFDRDKARQSDIEIVGAELYTSTHTHTPRREARRRSQAKPRSPNVAV